MKKIYLILLAIPVLAVTLLYLSVWWFIGGIAAVMIFVAYQFYVTRLNSLQARNIVLEEEVEKLNVQLEQSVIKEQKASRDATQVRMMKQELLSVLSHEIRTPMNGVIGTTLLLQDTPLTKEQDDYVTTIRNCGESLITTVNNILVNDILDLSKLHIEGNKLEYKDFNLRDSIEEVLELFTEQTNKSGIDLLYYIGENTPEQLIGDTRLLRQVLTNLVENAVKFTNKGEVVMEVNYTPPLAGNQPPELKFEVKDTGTGIEKEELKLLFKGISGKDHKNNIEQDRGLGLVICKKLVEMMGGTISAESKPGSGSVFSFTIPVTPSLKPVRSHARENEMELFKGKKILIVDDNATSASIFAKQVKAWKAQPVTAASGNDAIEILSGSSDINAVLVDMYLPGNTGAGLAKEIKEKHPGIPVTVISKPIRQRILRDELLDMFSPAGKDEPGESSQNFAEKYPLRILIAEDNLVNQKIAIKILKSLGYDAALANNGKEAIDIAANGQYDVILMDVQMPEMDGLEATRMLRTCLPVQPVIIALTANAMQGDRDACMQAGMDDYMSKPIDLNELLTQLEKWHKALKERRKTSA